MKIKLVIATRTSEADFFRTTATGRSLAYNYPSFIDLRLFPNNTKGLPVIYNQVIKESIGDPSTLVFMHDDLHILDYFWCDRISEGLEYFDVVGVVGGLSRVPKQSKWLNDNPNYIADKFTNQSGVIGHGTSFPPSTLNLFGPPRQKVMLLDGLLLASESKTLIENNLRFDERFKFHFYDLDFCRQAEIKNISCGTWDLSLIHESGGDFVSEEWNLSYQKYLEKWVE